MTKALEAIIPNDEQQVKTSASSYTSPHSLTVPL
jgi:hypothetical protein